MRQAMKVEIEGDTITLTDDVPLGETAWLTSLHVALAEARAQGVEPSMLYFVDKADHLFGVWRRDPERGFVMGEEDAPQGVRLPVTIICADHASSRTFSAVIDADPSRKRVTVSLNQDKEGSDV